jgi:hypothetical protein
LLISLCAAFHLNLHQTEYIETCKWRLFLCNNNLRLSVWYLWHIKAHNIWATGIFGVNQVEGDIWTIDVLLSDKKGTMVICTAIPHTIIALIIYTPLWMQWRDILPHAHLLHVGRTHSSSAPRGWCIKEIYSLQQPTTGNGHLIINLFKTMSLCNENIYQ